MNKHSKGFAEILINTVSSHRNLYLYLVLIVGLIYWIQKCNSQTEDNQQNDTYKEFKEDFNKET